MTEVAMERFDPPSLNGYVEDPDVVDANPDYLTIDELDAAEELLGGPIDMMSRMPRRGPAIRVLATIVKRRTDPDFPFERAGSLKIKFGAASVVPPTNGNGSEAS